MKRIFIAGGGTGGHFYPAYALSEYFITKGYEIYFFGSKNGIENKKPFPAKEKFLFDIKGVRGKNLYNKISSSINLLRTSISIKKYIKELNPEFCICFGGYTSIPLGIASFLSKKPLYIHEQNSVPSYSNLLLSKFAKKVFITFEFSRSYFSERKTFHTGIPIRKDLKTFIDKPKEVSRKNLNLPLGKKLVLVFGGSQGAKAINEYVYRLASHFPDVLFINITGKHKPKKYQNMKNLKIYEYIDNIGEFYNAADIIISRSGSSTVNEILAFGKPTIFIPFPYATSNHQFYNVKWLEEKGVCKIVQQSNMEKLESTLDIFLKNPPSKEKIKEFSITDAEDKIYKLIIS